MAKTLTKIALAVALTCVGISCSNHPEYHFNGKIGDEQVRFYEKFSLSSGPRDFLEIIKADGNKMKYSDYDGDLKADVVEITVGKNKTLYRISSENPAVIDVMKKAQEEFDDYLAKIMEIQTTPLFK